MYRKGRDRQTPENGQDDEVGKYNYQSHRKAFAAQLHAGLVKIIRGLLLPL